MNVSLSSGIKYSDIDCNEIHPHILRGKFLNDFSSFPSKWIIWGISVDISYRVYILRYSFIFHEMRIVFNFSEYLHLSELSENESLVFDTSS